MVMEIRIKDKMLRMVSEITRSSEKRCNTIISPLRFGVVLSLFKLFVLLLVLSIALPTLIKDLLFVLDGRITLALASILSIVSTKEIKIVNLLNCSFSIESDDFSISMYLTKILVLTSFLIFTETGFANIFATLPIFLFLLSLSNLDITVRSCCACF